MKATELIKELQDIIDKEQHDFDIVGNLADSPLTYINLSIKEPYTISLHFI